MTWSQPSSAGHTCSLLGSGEMCMHKPEVGRGDGPLRMAGPGDQFLFRLFWAAGNAGVVSPWIPEPWLSLGLLLLASPQKWVCAASLVSLGSSCRPGPVFLTQLCWRQQQQVALRRYHTREDGPCASAPWAWFSVAR